MVRLFSAIVGLIPLACACTKGPQAPSAANATAGELSPDTVVANVDGKAITLKELDESVAGQLRELDEQRFQARRQGLDQLINQTLVRAASSKKGISEEQYLKEEVDAKVTPPAEAQVQAFFEQNKAQLPPGAKLEDYKDRIVTYLSRQGTGDRSREVFNELRKQANVVVNLNPPPKPRVQVEARGPTHGPKDAKVTVVEFSDFQCPFCSRAKETVDKVVKKYDGKIKLVFRQFPLSFHPNARKAAEASLCADAQGKFWEYHDALFGDQSKLDIPGLKENAKKLGLDGAKFDACLDKGELASVVDADMQAAEKAGVSGTPAFFINGILLSGAQPIEEFERVIDAELAM